ncbi:MAG TPA: cellulase family glycosylhydrolase [Clostridia bacterium]|nr:cellulase family glycosylhydrolase [Clostridia bacterium]
MFKRFLLVVFSCAICWAQAAEPAWLETFDGATGSWPRDVQAQIPGRGGVIHISVAEGTPNPGRAITLSVPAEKLRGQQIFFGADVKTTAISHKPNPWNGVKMMLVIESADGKAFPQPEIPEGTHDWQRYSTQVTAPQTATNLTLVLGLEQVTGEAWFDNVRIVTKARMQSSLKVDPSKPVFRGHNLSRLRGAMAGNDLNEEDIKYFATVWKGNLLRLQIFESARTDRALEDYDSWLEQRLQSLDRVLTWCEKHRVMAVVDLHSPPGGQAFSAGYITARGRIFTQPQAQAKFVQVWEKIASRYKGRQIIWGFDLVNEPDDSMLAEDCLDWNTLADKTARAVRAIDPDRTLIIEPNQWGGPQAFDSFTPIDLPGVVYSFHFYTPMQFTHQGIHGNPGGVTYPGLIGTENWNKEALERAMGPAIAFAQKYRVHMYVGEFSAIRSAPAGSAAKYLSDIIEIFEKHGFDWSYHAYREWQGWSLEHEGPLDKPVKAQSPTDRQQAVTTWFSKNSKP